MRGPYKIMVDIGNKMRYTSFTVTEKGNEMIVFLIPVSMHVAVEQHWFLHARYEPAFINFCARLVCGTAIA